MHDIGALKKKGFGFRRFKKIVKKI